MKINSGHLIRKMRKEMGVSQEELAVRLYISPRHLSRIETGEADMDIWQFMAMLELTGYPSEDFWLLYLDSIEYEEYKVYRNIKRFLRDNRFEEAAELLKDLEKKDFSKRPLINQFILFVKTVVNKNITLKDALNEMNLAIRMTRPDFDEKKIIKYRMTYNEICILNHMAICLYEEGRAETAIFILEAIIKSRGAAMTSEEDKGAIFPGLMFNLSNILGREKMLKESLKVCNEAIELCREYNNLRSVPQILYNMACNYYMLGEEEQVYKIYLTRAYHCAYAQGSNHLAGMIKKDAENNFGVKIV